MNDSRTPSVCVIGAGAIGGFFGTRLAHAGAHVSAVARGATLQALQTQGWVLESGEGAGSRIVEPVQAVADARTLGPQDVVIVAVKSYSLVDVLPLVAPLLGPETVVLPALNGVPWWFTAPAAGLPLEGRLHSADPQGLIEAAIAPERVVGCVVYPACSSPSPGVVRHHSGNRIVLGEATGRPGAAPSARVSALVSLLCRAGFAAEASADIRTELWTKLLGNACFNPVSALTGSATDLLIDDPSTHALFAALMAETLAVGRAIDIDVAIDPEARIAVTRKLGHVKTSMLQDVEAGKPIEIDAILGAVIEIARRKGVPVPASETLCTLARMRARTFGLLKA